MDEARLIYPMFVMVLLTFSVLVRLFLARRKSVAEGAVSASYFKVYQGSPEPEASAKLARHFTNLFEAPVLFYAAYFSSWVVLLAMWAFFAVRVAG